MIANSISNRKLYYCLIGLIIFILIFLSLPLVLFLKENSDHEKNFLNQRNCTQNAIASMLIEYFNNPVPPDKINSIIRDLLYEGNNSIDSNVTINPINALQAPDRINKLQLNCTKFAFVSNLSIFPDNVQCPEGSKPCRSCPNICIPHNQQCDKCFDCPDKASDESECHDSNGMVIEIMTNIFESSKKTKNITELQRGLPEGCDIDEAIMNLCECDLLQKSVVFCDNSNLTQAPELLYDSVYKISFNNNFITSIDGVGWPRNLVSLSLDSNRISGLGNKTFLSVRKLNKLSLKKNLISSLDNDSFLALRDLDTLTISFNNISHIDLDSFVDLENLFELDLGSNLLTTFDVKTLRNSKNLSNLNLTNNMIDLPMDTNFNLYLPNIKHIFLEVNRIKSIRKGFFSNLSQLKHLTLKLNEIEFIENNSFENLFNLKELNLSFNKIKVIQLATFTSAAPLMNLTRLFMGSNEFKTFPNNLFKFSPRLRSLDLQNIEFESLNRKIFNNKLMPELKHIYFKSFYYCYYAIDVRICEPSTDGLSTTKKLLAFPILRKAVWIVSFVCIIGNIFVFIWRSLSKHEDRILSLFIKNLSLADLMMGIYLATIGYKDYKHEDNFGLYAIQWMSSNLCTSIGFLAVFSSELSLSILLIITIERYHKITSMNTFEENFQTKLARFYMLIAWLISFLVAFYPIYEWVLLKSDYYATNNLCIPLHIDQPKARGWKYSAFLYLGVNFTAVLIIMILYYHMYTVIMCNRKRTRPRSLLKTEKHEDDILAIRFFFIVVSDCLCWIPIVLIKVLALANFRIPPSIYGWIVVFIMPINSALNPIIYTLAAPTSLRDTIIRSFERFFFLIDKLGVETASMISKTRNNSSSGSEELDAPAIANAGAETLARGQQTTKKHLARDSNSTTCETLDGCSAVLSRQNHATGKGSADSAATLIIKQQVCSDDPAAPAPPRSCRSAALQILTDSCSRLQRGQLKTMSVKKLSWSLRSLARKSFQSKQTKTLPEQSSVAAAAATTTTTTTTTDRLTSALTSNSLLVRVCHSSSGGVSSAAMDCKNHSKTALVVVGNERFDRKSNFADHVSLSSLPASSSSSSSCSLLELNERVQVAEAEKKMEAVEEGYDADVNGVAATTTSDKLHDNLHSQESPPPAYDFLSTYENNTVKHRLLSISGSATKRSNLTVESQSKQRAQKSASAALLAPKHHRRTDDVRCQGIESLHDGGPIK